MKKLFNDIVFDFSSFILGVKNVFSLDVEQPSLYGPAPDPGSPTVPVNPGSSIFNIVSLISTIVLFLIGIFVLLNKKISNKVKIIVSIIILIILLILFYLNEYILFLI